MGANQEIDSCLCQEVRCRSVVSVERAGCARGVEGLGDAGGDNPLAFGAGIWHTNRVAPFSLAGSFPRVPSSHVTCLVNGAKERSQWFNEVVAL